MENKFMKKFFHLMFMFLLFFTLFITIGTAAYVAFEEKEFSKGINLFGKFNRDSAENDILNVAVFGVDKAGVRTDVIFVCSVNFETNKVNLLSIPRDTKVILDDKFYNELDNNRYIPKTKTVKINEVHAYAGRAKANEMSVKAIEKILGIKIDNYVKVNITAFREIVDGIGGVTMNVPRRMYYVDPVQGLYINLQPGVQHLDGRKAEQLVRFRKSSNGGGYRRGDVDRIQVQQMFLKELVKEVMDKENFNIATMTSLISSAYKYVQTDMDLAEMISYARKGMELNLTDLYMETLPGTPKGINGISYYQYDPEATYKMVKRLFVSNEKYIQTSLGKRIEILNGSGVTGLANKYKREMKDRGYNVVRVENYKGVAENYTKIITRQENIGKDLQEFFSMSKVEQIPAFLDDDIDIKIILGKNE
ncbi:MAG: LCP family protein [Clostridia bacterium]|nr:LCP family protein [Clostridia bacterium]